MAIFQYKKKSSEGEAVKVEQQFFDEKFRQELRDHGRRYFEQIMQDNAELFKKDLEQTISHINTELKDHLTGQLDMAIAEIKTYLKGHVVKQIDTQFSEYSTSMKEAHDVTLQAMREDARLMQQRHEQLSTTLTQTISDQESMLRDSSEQTKAELTKMRGTEALALQWLSQSLTALQEQHEQLADELHQNVAKQESVLVEVFEQNMSQIIERYLLSALGDQYDLKAQLPAIIKQMESNKQAIVDDMKL